MKGDILSFHMRYRGLISIHRLHRKINFGPLSFLPLVGSLFSFFASAMPQILPSLFPWTVMVAKCICTFYAMDCTMPPNSECVIPP